jgi:hypothetical protein
MIPPFNELGYLPPGDYQPTWNDFWERFAVNNYRRQIATGLQLALKNLGLAECRWVCIGGSFVTNKARPNDYDGCFDIFGIDESIIDPILLEPDLAAQRAKFCGELVPNAGMAGFFQTDKNGNPKGIIILDPTTIC